jgi:hypothetical protein
LALVALQAQSALAAPGSTTARPRSGIAFLRAGDLWLAPLSGGERRLTRLGGLRGLAAEGRRVAVVAGRSGDLLVFVGPDWRSNQVTLDERFVGPGCWRPGTRELFLARERGPEAVDDGLWRLDTGRRVRRQLLDGVVAEVSVHHRVRLSPSGTRVAAGGVIRDGLTLQARDLRSGARWSPLAADRLLGGADFAWMGENRLLLAAAPVRTELVALGGTPPGRALAVPAAGLQVLELSSGRVTPWLYPRGTQVLRICRAPGRRDRYAIGLGEARSHSRLPPMARRVEIVEGRTRVRRGIPLPAPAHVAGFTPDGRSLLVLMLRRTPWRDVADAVSLDIATGRRRLLARDVTEAAWVLP